MKIIIIGQAVIFYFLATSDFENETRLLEFSRVETVQTINFNITDDNVFEADEMFMAVLELANDSRIILQPNTTEISIIMDDDSKYNNFRNLYMIF